ncbi:MAG: hypothetical protein J7L11_03405 [Thermoprotei archaeon]|nr:hypothetical protein [Thermoprotei archaeon]
MSRTRVDKRWRITLPATARGNLRPRDEVIVEERGNMIVIRKAVNPFKIFQEVKLYVKEEKLVKADASEAKHTYGAVKD